MAVPDELDIQPENQLQSDQVQNLQEGDRIALYAVNQTAAMVLIGTVTTRQIDDLTADLVANARSYIGIDYSTMYEIIDGEITDVTDKLNDRPPYRTHLDEPLRDPPSPSLMYYKEDAFTLVIPDPTWKHGRAEGYYPAEVAVVLDVVFGDTIWPENVIPDDLRPVDPRPD